MSRVPLMGGFSLMDEGVHVLKITSATYNEEFGKIKLTLENAQGKKHFENFTLIGKGGEINESAAGAFSAFAKTAMNDQTLEDVDVEELKGFYIKGELEYREYTGNDGKTKKTTTKAQGTWWEEVTPDEIAQFEAIRSASANTAKTSSPAPTPAPAPTTASKTKAPYDLNALLGRK